VMCVVTHSHTQGGVVGGGTFTFARKQEDWVNNNSWK